MRANLRANETGRSRVLFGYVLATLAATVWALNSVFSVSPVFVVKVAAGNVPAAGSWRSFFGDFANFPDRPAKRDFDRFVGGLRDGLDREKVGAKRVDCVEDFARVVGVPDLCAFDLEKGVR